MTRLLVLASASPRRKDLLEEAGYRVMCVVSGAEELEVDHLSPAELALENARRKAAVVARRHPDDLVIAADTVVAMDGGFFGKPGDVDEALGMLRRLRGRTHEVVTGVVVMSGGEAREFFESTLVTFRDLSDEELRGYVESVHPMDKAGGYAAQGDDGRIIERLDGSLTNVIGLPMERLSAVLAGI